MKLLVYILAIIGIILMAPGFCVLMVGAILSRLGQPKWDYPPVRSDTNEEN